MASRLERCVATSWFPWRTCLSKSSRPKFNRPHGSPDLISHGARDTTVGSGAVAICRHRHWGFCLGTVLKWRRALGVEPLTPGTPEEDQMLGATPDTQLA